MKKYFISAISAIVLSLAVSGCSSDNKGASEANVGGLPDTMVWSAYSLGSGSYNDTSGIADAISSAYGTQIRLLPADTGIARLKRLTDGTADFAVLGDEYVFSSEGTFDFAEKGRGPQDLRFVWGPPTPLGLAVNGKSNTKTISDLKGKKVPRVLASDSVNQKMEAYLAYGGLTWNDVDAIDISYSDQANAFKAGQFDAIIMGPYGSALYEIENAVDIKWVSLDPNNKEGVENIKKIAPQVVVAPFSKAAGMEEGEEVYGISYPSPFVTRADVDADTVYNLVVAIDSQYDKFKNTTLSLSDYNLENVLKDPLVVPFHEGVVRYFKEKNVWSDEKEKKNNELIERQKKLQEGWKTTLNSSSDANFTENWLKWRKDNMK